MGRKRFPKYWERNNLRRPFPPLYEAVRFYGKENVYFPNQNMWKIAIANGVGKR